MPIRAYFLIITPALAAFLWWTSWYLQPEPPKVYPTAAAQSAAAKAGKPASTTARPASTTTGAAPAQAASAAPAQAAGAEAAASAPAPQTSDIKLVASTAVEDTKPVVQTPKAKKRKTARRKPRDTQAPAYAGNPYGSPYGASGYYGYQQPFGFGRW
jgi:hypothetical protein